MNADVMLFFSRAPRALALYEVLEAGILARCGDATIHVQKSQIAFDNGRRFAFASLRGKRLVVTFGLGQRVTSPRIAQAVEAYPGRWTHHVPVEEFVSQIFHGITASVSWMEAGAVFCVY